ncbi:uncharacterized protein RHO25_012394 [Cercospora beticola]|uniref:Uncharacterized protein n=1 Tax=Cercospora beticola TaxID=122368 RepID=A0ABZ0P7T4_CERBT|nr:hypothetical protein RHO25_012394 [Cercospora beticola]
MADAWSRELRKRPLSSFDGTPLSSGEPGPLGDKQSSRPASAVPILQIELPKYKAILETGYYIERNSMRFRHPPLPQAVSPRPGPDVLLSGLDFSGSIFSVPLRSGFVL